MTCYHPLTAYRLKTKNPKTGKNWICFKPKAGIIERLKVPCGQCSGCRLERSRIWAIRCMHELQSHEHSLFVTLTYNNENLPINSTLQPKDLQDFYKRLRKKHKIRHFSCGEYGQSCGICGQNEDDCLRLHHHKFERAIGRPHYHAIIFGLKLNDLTHYNNTFNGDPLYNSPYLEKTWNHGNVIIGNVTFESSAYVARYIMKKVTGKEAEKHYYLETDHATGQDISLTPEFIRMSNKPGIATEWYNKYKHDIYDTEEGTVIIRGGIKTTPPRFYEDKFNQEYPNIHQEIKQRRKLKAEEKHLDNTKARLATKEIIFNKKITNLQ